jgi:hypothetical protein
MLPISCKALVGNRFVGTARRHRVFVGELGGKAGVTNGGERTNLVESTYEIADPSSHRR